MQLWLESSEGSSGLDLGDGFCTHTSGAPVLLHMTSLQQSSLDFFHSASAGNRNLQFCSIKVTCTTNRAHLFGILLVKAVTGQPGSRRWRNRSRPSVGSGMDRTGSTPQFMEPGAK